MTDNIIKSRSSMSADGTENVGGRPSGARVSYHASGYGRTRMYTVRDRERAEEYFKSKKKKDPAGEKEENSRISSRGKEKLGEARREAGERRRFVSRRRGLLVALMLAVMLLLIVLVIYKAVFVVEDIRIVGDSRYTKEQLIEASGVSAGVNLYSFRGSVVEEQITLMCPYIKSVEVNRQMPGDVTITVYEDTAAYYADIFGELKLLSADLRVLETVESEEELPDGLIRLKLPSVVYSVSGRGIRFADERRERGIRDVLDAVAECCIKDRLTTVDMRDQFDIIMVCDSSFKLVIGDRENISRKLKTAEKVLEDPMFLTDNKIRIDLTIDGKTGVKIDNLMELD